MLSYTTLFVASLIVAAVIYFLFKVISDSSRSVYSSKNRTAIISSTINKRNDTTGTTGLAYKPSPFGQAGHASPKHIAKTNPAIPTDTINWGWQGSGVQLREPQLRPSQGAGESSHCSLYDTGTPQSKPNPGQHAGRLRREEQFKPAGRSYKVTREVDRDMSEPESLNKPWGW